MTLPGKNKWFYLLLLLAGWMLVIFVVNPLGEFPINDDWAYAKNVYHLAVNGVLKFSDWPAMTLIAQTLWGALFCKLFGFSFTTLRFSVLVISLLGIIFYYLIALKISWNEKVAFVSTAVLAFNPLYFALSYTFMTDVPFLVFLLGSVYFFTLYFEKEKVKHLVIATLFALIATMIRQLGVLIMIAMMLTYLLSSKFKLKRLLLLILCTSLVLLVMAGFSFYLEANKMLPAHYASISDLFKGFSFKVFLTNLISRTSMLVIYSGILLMPFVFYVLPSAWKWIKPQFRWIVPIVAVILCIPVFNNKAFFPVANIFYNLGLNPMVLKDTYWGYHLRPAVTDEIMNRVRDVGLILSFIFLLALIISIIHLIKKKADASEKIVKIQSGFILAGYLGFLLMSQFLFDRYFLPFIAFILLFLVSPGIEAKRWNTAVTIILIASISWFSILATHDNLAFNRARWRGLSALTTAGISPKNIDGGFEFNGWYETGKRNLALQEEKSWWFVDDDTYVVARGPAFGYKTIKTYYYNSFLTFRQDSILILKRFAPVYKDSTTIICNSDTLTENGTYFMTSVPGILAGNANTRTDREAHSGKYSIVLDKDNPYGFTMRLKHISPHEKMRITVWSKNNKDQAGIVVTAPDAKFLYRLSNVPDPENKDWKLLTLDVTFYEGCPFRMVDVYLWNHGGGSVFFDDLKITWYKNPYR